MDGALFVLAPLLLLLPFSGNGVAKPETWQLILAASATIMGMMCALLLARRPLIGGWLGSATTILGFVAFLPEITENPFAALSAAIGLIFILS
ncbi:MAG: hypothetical protein JW713_02735, partial [Pontiellaceae bacterium]|nr:hypothetical protein [Pontiellaceae bacterium]